MRSSRADSRCDKSWTASPGSTEARERDISSYMRHSMMNTIGIKLLGVEIVTLLAIQVDASNVEIGYLAAVFQFSAILLVITPRLIGGRTMRQVYLATWFSRGAVCVGYFLLLRFDGQPAVWIVIVVFTVFSLVRIVAAPLVLPVQQLVARGRGTTEMVARYNRVTSVSDAAAQLLSFLILSIEPLRGIPGLMVVIGVGIASNTIGALLFCRISIDAPVGYRKGRSVGVLFVATLRDHRLRTIAIGRWLGGLTMVLFGFGVALLRRSVGMPSNLVLLYTLAGSIAALVSAQSLRKLSVRAGSRVLLMAANAILVAAALTWAAVRPDLPYPVYFVLGFATFLGVRLRFMVNYALLLQTIPRDDRVSYTSMHNLVSGGVAIATGLFGGWLADQGWLMEGAGSVGPVAFAHHPYAPTYLVAAAASLMAVFVARRLPSRDEEAASLRAREKTT